MTEKNVKKIAVEKKKNRFFVLTSLAAALPLDSRDSQVGLSAGVVEVVDNVVKVVAQRGRIAPDRKEINV